MKRKVQHDLEVKDMTEAASQAGTMEAAPGSADGKPEEGELRRLIRVGAVRGGCQPVVL